MARLEVIASSEGLTIKLNGEPIAIKRGRKAWENMEGQRVNPRRWPKTVRDYCALAKASYVVSTLTK